MSRLGKLKKQIILEANIRLSEQASVANKSVTTPKVDVSAFKNDYDLAMRSIWFEVRNNIVLGGQSDGKPNGVMTWKYPIGTKETSLQLHNPDGSVVDQSKLDAYDSLFNQKLNNACEDNAWLTKIANAAFTKNQNKDKNKNFQTYLMTYIKDKSLVKDNGAGGSFNDGVFYAITMKAAIKFRLESGYKDSSYMIANKLL